MEQYKCEKGCCLIQVSHYIPNSSHPKPKTKFRKKAGVFIYDPKEDRVLLVQSRGQLWGPPKGSLEAGEGEKECAIREVKEETGLTVTAEQFTRATRVKNRAMYYYLETDSKPIKVQSHIEGNDANGIMWVKTKCLTRLIENGFIILNKHCKIVFNRFLNIVFPHSEFTTVKRK